MKRRGRQFVENPNQIPIDWLAAERERDAARVVDAKGVAEPPTESLPKSKRIPRRRQEGVVARFPVPCPKAEAVAAGRFGHDEQGKVIRPGADEVRAITENVADALIEMLDSVISRPGKPATADALPERFGEIIATYGQDFGDGAARQLDAYVRRQSSLEDQDRTDHTWQR